MKRVLLSLIVLCAASQVHAQTYDAYGRAHAPSGGMWMNGQYYAGGQYLPMNGSYTQSAPAQVPNLYGTPSQYQNWVNSNMIPGWGGNGSGWGYGGWNPPSYGFSDYFPGVSASSLNLTGRYTPQKRFVGSGSLSATPEPAREVFPVNREALAVQASSEADRIAKDPEIQAQLARKRAERGTYYGDPKTTAGMGQFNPPTPAQMRSNY